MYLRQGQKKGGAGMSTIEVLQGSDDWRLARAGKVTASRICDVLAKIKSGEAASRRNYKAQIIAELLTGQPQESGFVSAEMKFGTENEPFARAVYEIKNDLMVEQVGFVPHPTIERAGASPDGYVNSDGLVEIKVPNTATHIAYILANEVPADYQPQMTWQMACTGRKYCDFVSYEPRLPEHMQLFVKRFERDDKRIAEMEAEVIKFLGEVDQTLEALNKLCPEPAIG
jgi:putative phage-type endonuclease